MLIWELPLILLARYYTNKLNSENKEPAKADVDGQLTVNGVGPRFCRDSSHLWDLALEEL